MYHTNHFIHFPREGWSSPVRSQSHRCFCIEPRWVLKTYQHGWFAYMCSTSAKHAQSYAMTCTLARINDIVCDWMMFDKSKSNWSSAYIYTQHSALYTSFKKSQETVWPWDGCAKSCRNRYSWQSWKYEGCKFISISCMHHIHANACIIHPCSYYTCSVNVLHVHGIEWCMHVHLFPKKQCHTVKNPAWVCCTA